MSMYDVFTGASNGVIKGINLASSSFSNICAISKSSEITHILSRNSDEDLLCADLSNSLNIVDIKNATCRLVHKFDAPQGKTKIVGLNQLQNNDVLCTVSSGCASILNGESYECKSTMNVGADVSSLSLNLANNNEFCSGGVENLLKTWDMENPDKPTFTAKNVAHDWLQLRKKVWITGAKYLPETSNIVTCTGYGKIRVYDPSSGRRRPVVETENGEWGDLPFTCMDICNTTQLIAGNTQGGMALFDIRMKGRMVQTYRGLAGGIRTVVCHPSLPYVFSGGLDRFMRVHHINDKRIISKIYCKVAQNTIHVDKNLTKDKIEPLVIESGRSRKWRGGRGNRNIEIKDELNESDNEDNIEEIWKQIGEVKPPKPKKIKVAQQNDDVTKSPTRKKRKIEKKCESRKRELIVKEGEDVSSKKKKNVEA